MRVHSITVVLGLLFGLTRAASAQDLERVKALYVAAAYEEALAAMPPAASRAVRTDLEQYRALCFLALGRETEAVGAIERVVRVDPMYLPPPSDTSPRMRGIFAEVRARLVPDLARQAYLEAKGRLDAQQPAAAQAGFKRTRDLIDSLAPEDRQSLADLRMLAEGFLSLTAAANPPAPIPAVGVLASDAAAAPAGFVPPVAVREQLPVWSPPDSAAMRTEYVGVLLVTIAEDGTVSSASMLKPTHPAYDAAATRAARGWAYKPATRAGRPVPSQKHIQIRLVPR